MVNFRGSNAVVTAATSGVVGRGGFASEGANIYLGSRNRNELTNSLKICEISILNKIAGTRSIYQIVMMPKDFGGGTLFLKKLPVS